MNMNDTTLVHLSQGRARGRSLAGIARRGVVGGRPGPDGGSEETGRGSRGGHRPTRN